MNLNEYLDFLSFLCINNYSIFTKLNLCLPIMFFNHPFNSRPLQESSYSAWLWVAPVYGQSHSPISYFQYHTQAVISTMFLRSKPFFALIFAKIFSYYFIMLSLICFVQSLKSKISSKALKKRSLIWSDLTSRCIV